MSIRCSERSVAAAVKRIDYLLALNAESLHIHLPDLADDGMAFCLDVDKDDLEDPRLHVLPQAVVSCCCPGAALCGCEAAGDCCSPRWVTHLRF